MLTCRPALGNSSGGRGLGATAHTGRNCEKLALQGCGEGTFLEASNSLQEKIKKCSLVIITCNPIASSSFQKHSFVAKNLVFLHQCWELLPSIHKGSFYQLVSCANNLHEKFPQIASVVLKMTKAVTGWGPRPKKGDHPKCGAIRVEGLGSFCLFTCTNSLWLHLLSLAHLGFLQNGFVGNTVRCVKYLQYRRSLLNFLGYNKKAQYGLHQKYDSRKLDKQSRFGVTFLSKTNKI